MKNKRFSQCFLALLFVAVGTLIHLPAMATNHSSLPVNTVDVSTVYNKLNLDGTIHYLEDPKSIYTYEDIISGNYYGDFKQTNNTFNEGMTPSSFWFVQKFTNLSNSAPLKRLLEISYPPLDHIDMFIVSQDGKTKTINVGDSKVFNNRPIRNENYLFPITISPGEEKLVLFKVQSNGGMRVPINLWEPASFEENNRQYVLIMGIYFGIMLLMFVYNLCIFISVKDTSYLLYIGYVASHTLLQSTLTGFASEFLWPNTPWFNNEFLIYNVLLVQVFALTFASTVLNTKKTSPAGHRFIKAFLVMICVSFAFALILPYTLALQVVLLLGMVMTIFGLMIGIHLSIKGYKTAQFFITAWVTFLCGGLLYVATTAGLLPANIFTTNALIIGSTLEVALLSWTVADRFHRMQHEKTVSEKTAKNALQKVNRTLVESHQLKDEFLATISHELRTPMNGILSSIGHLKQVKDPIEQEPFIHSADLSANHMMLLIDSVLSYTELLSNESNIEHAPFQLSKVLSFLDHYFSSLCTEKNLTFMIDVDDDVPSLVLGDQRKITQVLVNLIDNAIKFTEAGYVRLSVDLESLEKPTKQARVSFKIQDTGIGIPAELGSLIFERFQQADHSFHRGYGGLGIGLAIAKQISTLLKADLFFESVPEQGTTFTFTPTLEYTRISTPLSPKALYSIDELAADRTALVVEDNKVNQLVLKTTLKKLGFNVICAENGQAGIDTLKENCIDIVLMDCQMPIMDGFEATQCIRQLPNGKSLVPIIAVTANAMSKDKQKCMESGMNDYMSKPVDIEELNEKLLKWLPLQKVINTEDNEKSKNDKPENKTNVVNLSKH